MNNTLMNDAISISYRLQGSTMLVEVSGIANVNNVRSLDSILTKAMAHRPNRVVIDLSRIDAMAALAQGQLNMFIRSARINGAEVHVVQASGGTLQRRFAG